MRRLFQMPLVWMVIAECAVVGSLVLVAWHTIGASSAPGVTGPFLFPPAAVSPADSALPVLGQPVTRGTARGPAPGLNLGVAFWRVRLGSLNRDEAAFEALEWRITHVVMEAARDYLETVVLPSVRAAEGGSA